VEQRYYVPAAASWLSVLGGDHRLVQPVRVVVAFVEHAGWLVLPGGPGRVAISRPEIFNSDQGAQFTAQAFTSRLLSHGVAISMDGCGRALDNVFIERLWRTVKYEEVYLNDYDDGLVAERSLDQYFRFYCQERVHQSLGYLTPADVYHGKG
jgi:transposase InsO family protein